MWRFLKNNLLFFILFSAMAVMMLSHCAQIVAPTGGPKDTLPPVLITASPPDSTLHFHSEEIVMEFNEFIQLQDLQSQLIIAPNPDRRPQIRAKLRTLTIEWNDTLKPNTTYIINMGNAIEDINEGNPLKGFRYVFSTGSYLDSLEIHGKLVNARTGLPDSTAIVMLYTQMTDSVVSKEKPVYYARSTGDGSFMFQNLPHDTFKVFALDDANGNLQYRDSTEAIAFLGQPLILNSNKSGMDLYLFKEKETVSKPENEAAPNNNKKQEKLTFSTSLKSGKQDLKEPLGLLFSKPLQKIDTSQIFLFEDTTFTPVSFQLEEDTSRKKITLVYTWKESKPYRLILDSAFATDTSGTTLAKKDTINFSTKSLSDYGSLTLHFDLPGQAQNVPQDSLEITAIKKDTSEKAIAVTDTAEAFEKDTATPQIADTSFRINNRASQYVVQLFQNDEMIYSSPLKGNTWKKEFLDPGEYQVRILKDDNGNGKWDRGCYYCEEKRQPERVYSISQKFTIKANWDNDYPDLKFSFEP